MTISKNLETISEMSVRNLNLRNVLPPVRHPNRHLASICSQQNRHIFLPDIVFRNFNRIPIDLHPTDPAHCSEPSSSTIDTQLLLCYKYPTLINLIHNFSLRSDSFSPIRWLPCCVFSGVELSVVASETQAPTSSNQNGTRNSR